MNEQNATFILGRQIGADQGRKEDGQLIELEGFVPNASIDLPAGNVRFNLRTGHATTYDAVGNAEKDADFIPVIAGL